MGSVVDADKGVVKVVSARNRRGDRRSATFSEGRFLVRQKHKKRAPTVAKLKGGGLRGCRGPRAAHGDRYTSERRGRRRLFGRGRGRHRTRGRHGAGSVRGTEWVTVDTCRGTRFKVFEGELAVRDFDRGRTVILQEGESYFATARH